MGNTICILIIGRSKELAFLSFEMNYLTPKIWPNIKLKPLILNSIKNFKTFSEKAKRVRNTKIVVILQIR